MLNPSIDDIIAAYKEEKETELESNNNYEIWDLPI